MLTLYNAVSADGFIARKDGSEDFIPDEAWNDFLKSLTDYDVVVMGRKTYDAIQRYPVELVEPFEKLSMKRVVISHDSNLSVKPGYSVITSVSEISALGKNVLITSGPTLNTAVLEAGIIDRVVFNTLPEKIGEGVPVFNTAPALALQSTQEMTGGRALRTYVIKQD